METAIQPLKQYFRNVLDLRIEPKPWQGANHLPFFMRDTYQFYEAKVRGNACIFMEFRERAEQRPAVVRDHLDSVIAQSNELCIYLRSAISSYNRKRLIEQRVPFVVPGNQMYLPDLGIDLREHFRNIRAGRKSIGPAAQTVVLYALVFGLEHEITPSELAVKLGYTRMTMTRALNELEARELGEINRKGRERWLHFPSGRRQLWDKAQPLMQSPVRKRLWATRDKRFERLIVAGLSALARYSMLNPPEAPVYALTANTWKTQKQRGIAELPFFEKGGCEVEVWQYQPDLFARGRLVDLFSLYLSLRDNQDERVAQALAHMMEKIKW